MASSQPYSRQVQPEHLPYLKVVEGAAAQLERAYAERAAAMWESARAGCSLENIGRAAGLTRERVRQILEESAHHVG